MNTDNAGRHEGLEFRPGRAHLRREIASHFAGRIAPDAERALRDHLPACHACREHYERHLLMSALDPAAPEPAQRIASGLGLRFDRNGDAPPFWGRRLATMAIPVAAAALLFWWTTQEPSSPRPVVDPGSEDFSARSARPAAAVAPTFWIYRTTEGQEPVLVERTIAARDELAFAYANPGGKAFLMILGVDEHGHVFWFHPGWLPGQAAPLSVPAVAGTGPHEFTAAIRHELDGQRLTIHALWSDAPLSVDTVERKLRAANPETSLALDGGVLVTSRHLEVRP